PCWEGIAWMFSTTSVTQGTNSTIRAFDVSNASRFNVSLLAGTGDPDVYVQFQTQPTTTSWACRPFGSTFPETCDLAVPAGQTTAYVMVRGFTDATYLMRVEYAGN